MKTEWEKRDAEKAYYAALAAFKVKPPTVVKNKHVLIPHNNGRDPVEYDHATLDECINKTVPALACHGLSHKWEVDYLDNELIKVTCTLRHRLGHSESVSMQAPRDSSGYKNSLQEQQSTVTYLERYTILAITGLAAAGMDDDGLTAEDQEQANKTLRISGDQKQILIDLLRAAGADNKRFLKHFQVETLDNLPQYRFEEAKSLLQDKIDRKNAGNGAAPSARAQLRRRLQDSVKNL